MEEECGMSRKERLRQQIVDRLEERLQVGDEELQELIDDAVQEEAGRGYFPLEERMRIKKELFDAFRRLGILQELVEDPEVTEIMVNGPDAVFAERNGQIFPCSCRFESEEQLEDLIQQMVSRVNRSVNMASPIADARLEDGSRVHVVLPPAAIDGPVLNIRKFPEPITMKRLIEMGSITEEAAAFLDLAVRSGCNIFISGGTGSGKTTFLNALAASIPAEQRVITIEDSAELQIRHIPNLVRLETRQETRDGVTGISVRDLLKASLRMRPDRIIVGEVRDGAAADLVQAMNTGHDGSLSTGHANSARDMLSRLETMILTVMDLPFPAVQSQLASALDLMVHLGRLRDHSRRVLEISEVRGYEDGKICLEPIFLFEEKKKTGPVEGELKKVGRPMRTEKFDRAGFPV